MSYIIPGFLYESAAPERCQITVSHLFSTTQVASPHLYVIVVFGEQPDTSDCSDVDAGIVYDIYSLEHVIVDKSRYLLVRNTLFVIL